MQTHNLTPRQPDTVEMSNIRRIEWQRELVKRDVWQCCLNCQEWQAYDERTPNRPVGCALHKAYPPVEVIIVGCKDHMIDIPF